MPLPSAACGDGGKGGESGGERGVGQNCGGNKPPQPKVGEPNKRLGRIILCFKIS
jgi:hypothetical protein